jgi:hypothetical protein
MFEIAGGIILAVLFLSLLPVLIPFSMTILGLCISLPLLLAKKILIITGRCFEIIFKPVDKIIKRFGNIGFALFMIAIPLVPILLIVIFSLLYSYFWR